MASRLLSGLKCESARRAHFFDDHDGLWASQFPYLEPRPARLRARNWPSGLNDAQASPGPIPGRRQISVIVGHAVDMDDSLPVHAGVALHGAVEIDAPGAWANCSISW